MENEDDDESGQSEYEYPESLSDEEERDSTESAHEQENGSESPLDILRGRRNEMAEQLSQILEMSFVNAQMLLQRHNFDEEAALNEQLERPSKREAPVTLQDAPAVTASRLELGLEHYQPRVALMEDEVGKESATADLTTPIPIILPNDAFVAACQRGDEDAVQSLLSLVPLDPNYTQKVHSSEAVTYILPW